MVFDSLDYLEPRCPGCKAVIRYEENTRFDEQRKGHVCICCGTFLK